MQDPRCKHKYVDRLSNNVEILNGDEDDESDKRLETQYHTYSCLIFDLAHPAVELSR